MDSTKVLITIAIVLLLGGAAWFALSDQNRGDTMMEEEDAMTENEDTMMEENGMESGAYQDYAPEKVAAAGDGTVLLYFHADWCPICRPLDADIRSNEDDIPAGITILKVDFDTATDLRQKYGVTVQHTIVQIDSEGEMLKRWSVMDPQLSAILSAVQS